MTPNLRQQAGLTQPFDYPSQLMDFEASHRATKAAITELRASPQLGAAQGSVERNTGQTGLTSTQTSPREAQPKASKRTRGRAHRAGDATPGIPNLAQSSAYFLSNSHTFGKPIILLNSENSYIGVAAVTVPFFFKSL